jgi:neutral ceramidase
MRIGDYVLANMPGEMTVEMARRVRKHLLDCPIDCDASGRQILHHAVLVGLANDYMSYATTPEEYDYQWYEGTFTLWGRQEGPFLLDRFGQLVDAMLHGRQVTFQEPPDTSGSQADNVSPVTQALSNAPLTPRPGTVLVNPPVTVKRGQVVDFSWVGGQPSAEVVQDRALVSTQCDVNGEWRSAFSDESPDDITDYARAGVTDHWGSRWDVTLDAPARAYRFAVTGRAYIGGQITPYSVNSQSFTVVPSDGLTVRAAAPGTGSTLVQAAYPKADPTTNFRLRPTSPTSGRVTITVHHVGGTTQTGAGGYQPALHAYAVPISSQPGDTVTVAAGGLVDAVANTNGAPQSLTVGSTLPATSSTGLTIPAAPGLPTSSVVQTCSSSPTAEVGHASTRGTTSPSAASGSAGVASITSAAAGTAGTVSTAGRLGAIPASRRAWPGLVSLVLVLGVGAYALARRLRRHPRR